MSDRRRHDWTEADDIGLMLAIDEVADLREHYQGQG